MMDSVNFCASRTEVGVDRVSQGRADGLGVDDHLTDGQEVGPLVLGGRLAVVDYLPGDTPHGPAAPVRVDPETVKTELAQAGWTFSKSLDLLPEQYVLIFEAPKKANENPNG